MIAKVLTNANLRPYDAEHRDVQNATFEATHHGDLNVSELFRYTNLEDAIRTFMTTGGQSVDKFDAAQAGLYLGLQFEELSEKIEALRTGTITGQADNDLLSLWTFLKSWAKRFKEGAHRGDLLRCDHAKLIDADFDLAWVSVGALFSESNDTFGALAVGSYSNMAKFPGGVCTKDANGKIQKPDGWQKPNFEPFVDKSVQSDLT